jgi:hypothetical protein
MTTNTHNRMSHLLYFSSTVSIVTITLSAAIANTILFSFFSQLPVVNQSLAIISAILCLIALLAEIVIEIRGLLEHR